jgi:Nif-specific regulatory protein
MQDTRAKLGPFAIGKRLGEGVHGEVFAAKQGRQKASRAVKILHRFERDPHRFPDGRLEALNADLQALAFDHSNLVMPRSAGVAPWEDPATGEPSDVLYLVSDFVEGPDLYRFTARAAWSTILEVFVSILRGLEALHGRGLRHGHLCASNVIVFGQGPRKSARLLDAGLALEVAETRSMGGLRSFAPEVLRGEAGDRRSDLYDLGCLFFECATRSPLYSASNDAALVQAHLNEAPRSARELKRSVPIAVEKLITGLLQKDPAERPPSANAVIRELNRNANKRFSTETKVRMASALSPRFRGRDPELTVLSQCLPGATAGPKGAKPGVIVVTADPGQGRTRLLEEIRLRSDVRWVRPEFPTTASLLEAVSSASIFGADDIDPLAAEAPFLRRLLPELSDEFAPAAAPLEMRSERQRIMESAVRFLFASAQAQPMAIALDDVQLATPLLIDTLHLLSRDLTAARSAGSPLGVADDDGVLPRAPTDAPLLVVLSLSPEELYGRSAEASINALLAHPGVREVRLESLNAQAMGEVLASALGRDLSEVRDLVTRIVETARGNVVHAMWLLAELAERAAVPSPDGAWNVLDEVADPVLLASGPTEILKRRLAAIPRGGSGGPGPTQLLAALALGGDADLDLLANAFGRTEAEIRGWARSLERAGLLEALGADGRGRCRLASVSLVEAFLPCLSTEESRDVQRLVGLAAARLSASPSAPRRLADVAAAQLMGTAQAESGVPFALLAASRALADSQPERVRDLLEPALRILERKGATGPGSAEHLTDEARDAIGGDPGVTALLLASRAEQALGRPGPARGSAQKAYAAARQARLPREMVRALLLVSKSSLDLSDAAQARTSAEEAVTLAADSDWRRGAGMATHSRGLAERAAGDYDEALSSLEEARAIFAEHGYGLELGKLLIDAAELRCERGAVGALDTLRLALEIEEEADRSLARIELLKARMLRETGELAQAQRLVERAIGASQTALDLYGVADGLGCLAGIMQANGELSAARRHEEAALSIRERLGDEGGAAEARTRLGRILTESGDLVGAEQTLLQAIESFKKENDRAHAAEATVTLAAMHLSRGDLSRARDAVDRATEDAKAVNATGVVFEAQCLRARLSLIQGDLAGAEELAASTAENAARQGHVVPECAARFTLGMAKLCRGNPVDAERELRDAFDLARDRGEWALVARARLSIARVHLTRGEPSGALGEVGKARDLAQRLEDSLLEVESMISLARLHMFLGQVKRAGLLLEQAQERVAEKGIALPGPNISMLQASVILARAGRGEEADLDKAAALFDVAEREGHSSTRRGLRAEIDCARAALFLQRGDAASARERAESALEIAKVTGNRIVGTAANQLLARARRAQGRHEDALAAAEGALEGAKTIRDGEAQAAALLERGLARRALGQTLLAAHDLRDAASQLRGIWASLSEDLRPDYQSKPLAIAIVKAATEITREAEAKLKEQPAVAPAAPAAAAAPAPAATLSTAPLGEADSPEALRDPLTNLYAHNFFSAQLETEIKRGQRHSRRLALLKVNIDRFKLVRELYGPKTAKKIIRDVAGLLLRHVRDVDVVARYFGDEFEVLLPDTDQAGALLTAERIREAVEAHRFEHDDEKIELTLTMGVALFPGDAKDRDALICRADEALYNARNRGGNTVFTFGVSADVPLETSPELRELDQLMLTRDGRTILSMVSRLVNQELDMDNVIELVTGMVVEATRGERGFLMLKGPNGEFSFRHGRNMDDKVIGTPEAKISNGIAKEVAETGEPIHVAEALDDTRFRDFKSVMDLNLRSIICAPIKVANEILGVIYVDHNQVARNFNQEDLNFLVAIAEKVAIPIKNSKRLREAEDRLAAAEARIKTQAADLETKYSYSQIVGRSEAMQRVFKLLDRIVETAHSVVIHGESGTGKELIARAIHYNGPRKARPFVAENCAALSDSLLEAELFGHVKGAFTGADRDSKGLFELASGGTLFLDEIGDMSERMQKKLLRVLQEGEVRPVGGKRVFHVDVRIVSASNKDLKKLVQERKFREDLYYRLNVITVELPPLRERRDDVVLLSEFFLEQHREAGAVREIERDVVGCLMNYDWPGNVRELENEINRLVAMSDSVITVDALSSKIREGASSTTPKAADGGLSKYYGRSLKEVEYEFMRDIILYTLENTNWHRTKAAKVLKVPTSTLFNKMKKYGIG